MPEYTSLEISEAEMMDFIESRIWKAIAFEFEERDKTLIQILRIGSNKDTDAQLGNDDTIRGRLSELDYARSIPEAILADIRLAKTTKAEEERGE